MVRRLILYAEDDADDRFVFEQAFAPYAEEIEIKLFADGQEIINHLTSGQQPNPSLIVLDINMPKLDGKGALRILRATPEFANTPIALLTTSTSHFDKEFAKLYNAGFFTKPMDQKGMQNIAKSLSRLAMQGTKTQ